MPLSSPRIPGHPAFTRTPGIILIAVLALFLALSPALAQDPRGHGPVEASPSASPAAGDEWAMEAVRPELRDAVQAQLPENLATYRITASLEGDAGELHEVRGHLALTWTNTTGEPLDTLPFRLYANGPDDEHDAQLVDAVTIDGAAVTPELTVDNSVLDVPFASTLAPGASVDVAMDFVARLPTDSRDHYGIFGFDADTETWAMAHWYPVVAGRDPSSGWVLDPPSRNGDPIFSDTALYDVTVTGPASWRIVTTGVASGDAETEGSLATRRFVSGPVRDFTIVADEDFEVVTRESNGVTFNSWYNPGEEDAGTLVAESGERSIMLFDELIGSYPYREIDFVPVDMRGAAGCEFPGLIYMGHSYYDDEVSDNEAVAIEFTVAHEVVHQWFYGLVGNNQYDHAFIDEGLTNYLSADVYFEHTQDEAAADEVMDTFVRDPFEAAVEGGLDPVVAQPTDDFPNGRDYAIAAYAKAPLGFEAIHNEMGDEAFFAALRTYVGTYSYRVAEPDDLLAAFETAYGGDLDLIWDHWFEEQHGEDDIDD